jgi:CysZ protein
MGFFRGLLAPFHGFFFVARHGLWGYLMLPLLLNVGLAVGAVVVGLRLVRQSGFVSSASGIAGLGLEIGLHLLAAVVALLLFVVLQPLLSAPFIDLLSERVERIARGRAPAVGVLRSLWEAGLHGALKSLLYALALLMALALGALTGVGALVGGAFYALFLAYDGFDYPLARRRVSFAGKWRYLALHPGQTLGYCCGAVLLYLVPLAALCAPAFAAVGATLAFLETLETDAERTTTRALAASAQGRLE